MTTGIQQLQCPQCGGQLDPSTLSSAVIQCTYCSAHSILTQGELRTVGRHALEPGQDAAQLRAGFEQRLRDAGFEDLPALEVREETLRYLMRRGRARVCPRDRNNNTGFAEQYEEVREGLFGIPLDEGGDTGLVYLKDDAGFVPAELEIPGDLRDEIVRFDDRVSVALEADRARRILETSGLQIQWAGFDVRASWRDEAYLVDIPVVVYSFTHLDSDDATRRVVTGGNRSGQYDAVLCRHDGEALRWNIPELQRLPSRKTMKLVLLGVAVAGALFVAAVLGVVVLAMLRSNS